MFSWCIPCFKMFCFWKIQPASSIHQKTYSLSKINSQRFIFTLVSFMFPTSQIFFHKHPYAHRWPTYKYYLHHLQDRKNKNYIKLVLLFTQQLKKKKSKLWNRQDKWPRKRSECHFLWDFNDFFRVGKKNLWLLPSLLYHFIQFGRPWCMTGLPKSWFGMLPKPVWQKKISNHVQFFRKFSAPCQNQHDKHD